MHFRVLLTCLLITQTLQAQQFDLSRQQVRTLVTSHMAATHTPGVQLAVMHEGELVMNEAFGVIDEGGKPTEVNTLFRIASVSKPLTALAVMKLVEEQKLDLDADIRNYVESFPDKYPELTASQLMSSTAGIRHYTNADPEFNTIDYPTSQAALDRFASDSLLYTPGKAHHYSSYGWTLLSSAVEAVQPGGFEAIMEDSWNAIGLEQTCFDSEQNRMSKEVTKAFSAPKRDERYQIDVENRSYIYAGGGYLSTAEDLCRFADAMLNNVYVKQATKERMWSPTQLNDGSEIPYGLGWEIGQSRIGTKVVYHGGNMESARAHLIVYPDLDLSLAWIANTGQHVFFNEREAQVLAECFAAQLINDFHLPTDFEGEWNLEVTSLRGKVKKGNLRLDKNEEGLLEGTITFKRYRKKEEHPIVALHEHEGILHLVAVTPMFDDFYIKINGSALEGYWLHDFNVNGTLTDSDEWGPFPLTGTLKNQP